MNLSTQIAEREPEEERELRVVEGRERPADAKGATGHTVRSGYAYDFDSTEAAPPLDAERAAKIKAELGDGIVRGLENRPAYRVAKRIFDIVLSRAVLICFSWLYLAIALLIKIDDLKDPMFFKQTCFMTNQKSCLLSTISNYSGAPLLLKVVA